MGTGFTAASTVSFGGTAATVSYQSATQLTATVPAGLAAGSAPMSVTTGSTTPATQPFTVLAVYDGGAVGACATASTGDGAWHYLLSSGGQVAAAYQYSGASLGTPALDVLRADPTQPGAMMAGAAATSTATGTSRPAPAASTGVRWPCASTASIPSRPACKRPTPPPP